jgi:hypothetical protein
MAMLMKRCDNFACKLFFIFFLALSLSPSFDDIVQVFDGKEKIFNVSSDLPAFQLVRLPSDARLIVRVMYHSFSYTTTTHKQKKAL